MKKKISFGIAAMIMIAGAFVFANSGTTKQANNICPDRPGCICSKQTSAQVVAKPTAIASTEKNGNCPSTPNCICK